MDTSLFREFWWLIFPLFAMISGLIGMFNHFNHRKQMLDLLKSYADQGKDPPAAILDSLRSDEDRDYDYSHRGRRHRGRGPWMQFVVFAALASGFGYAGHFGDLGNANAIFLALATAFTVAAAAMFVFGVICLLRKKD